MLVKGLHCKKKSENFSCIIYEYIRPGFPMPASLPAVSVRFKISCENWLHISSRRIDDRIIHGQSDIPQVCSSMDDTALKLHHRVLTIHSLTIHNIVFTNSTMLTPHSLLYTALHCKYVLNHNSLHCTALHCTALHWNSLHCTTLHCTSL